MIVTCLLFLMVPVLALRFAYSDIAGYRRRHLLDDLSSWPLPKDVAELTGAAWVSRASLHDLLNAVIGSPQVLDTDRSAISAQRAAALVLFASSYVVSRSRPPAAPFWLNGDIHSADQGRSLRLGSEWLARQFPRRAFPAAVEDVIAGASRLAYA